MESTKGFIETMESTKGFIETMESTKGFIQSTKKSFKNLQIYTSTHIYKIQDEMEIPVT